MAKEAKTKTREVIDEWRNPIEAEGKRKVEARKNLTERRRRQGKGGLARAEAAKRLPYQQEPFCTANGKEVKETFQFRVLVFRADCTMQVGSALEDVAECVVKARWPVAWMMRQIGLGAASKFVSSRTDPKALFACEVHRNKSLGEARNPG